MPVVARFAAASHCLLSPAPEERPFADPTYLASLAYLWRISGVRLVKTRDLRFRIDSPRHFENRSKNKLRTEYPGTGWKTVKQGACKSLRGKDGPLIYWAHNPKVAGSNPAPATNLSILRCPPGIGCRYSPP